MCECDCLAVRHISMYVPSVFLLSMHPSHDLLDAYSPYLFMSRKMQIKASQVLDG